jgi:hypothetical protein
MKTRLLFVGTVVGLVACAPALECVGTAIGSALGRVLGIGVAEGLSAPGRPDEAYFVAAVDGGAPRYLYVSGAHDAGRLALTFDGPVVGGTLPRFIDDAGSCTSPGDFAYLVVHSGNANTVNVVSATLSVSTTTQADGGTPTLFHLTQMSLRLADAGMTPLADHDINVQLP